MKMDATILCTIILWQQAKVHTSFKKPIFQNLPSVPGLGHHLTFESFEFQFKRLKKRPLQRRN